MGKREDILNATLDLVVEQGLESFSFSKLFERAGVGAGTVYNYFAGKDVLLAALFATLAERMNEGVFRSWSPDLSTRAQLESLLRGFALHALANPKEVTFIEMCSRASPSRRALLERVTPAQEVSLRLVAQAQAEGIVRQMEPHLAVTIASGMVTAVLAAVGSGKYAFGDVELDIVLAASWRAIATDAGLRAS